MTDVICRYKSGKLNFETMVNLENAIKMKKGEKININDVIRDRFVYTDLKKGMRAGAPEMENVFGTTDYLQIVQKIVQKGQLETTQEFRDEAIENRRKQIVDFLTKNAMDARTLRPFTSDMISNAIKEAGVKIDNQPVEKQVGRIVEELKKIIPIKISTKKIRIKIPPQFTGQIYGLVNEYKEKEEWFADGSLEVVLNIPVGLQIEFYDKLNSVTHGAALTSEIKE
ncbi:MAG: ribosome assembly factor SBDS [Candidatus Nanoarchaeia archaeon]|nr:ribosome assembly factor SBDS [Candidatus Nanoarchaeia archaeon]